MDEIGKVIAAFIFGTLLDGVLEALRRNRALRIAVFLAIGALVLVAVLRLSGGWL
jgi:diacylglycerol kinase